MVSPVVVLVAETMLKRERANRDADPRGRLKRVDAGGAHLLQAVNLVDGAVLLQVPKGVNGAKIHAPGVTAVISGTTGMFEYHPGVYKFLVLEGTGRLYRPGHLGDSLLVRAGQLVIGPLERSSTLLPKLRPIAKGQTSPAASR